MELSTTRYMDGLCLLLKKNNKYHAHSFLPCAC